MPQQFAVPGDADSSVADHIEEGFQQAERGELIDGDQVRAEMQAMKDEWSKKHLPR